MKKYFVFNPGPNMAVELKPGFGEFRILPDKRIEVATKELAESLVVDSNYHLKLEVVEVVEKVEAKKPEIKTTISSSKKEENSGPSETK